MKTCPHSGISRRSFSKVLGAAGLMVPMYVENLLSAPPSDQLRHLSFGGGGMAGHDLGNFSNKPGLQIVAIAEVDKSRWKGIQDKYPKAKLYQDWRELLDKDGKDIQTANVGTPDHMHAPIAMSAMQLGINVYVQKPLTHELHEARRLTEFAREKKLVTQMGIQCHSMAVYRIGVELIQSGAIGKIKEAHLWCDRGWGDAAPLPTTTDPVPETFDWNGWLGVCAMRPFLGNGYYHPGNWRKRTDFGTGSLGDMGCHIFDPIFEGLGLTSPISVESRGPAANAQNWGLDEELHYVFPGTQYTEGQTVNFSWYDGKARPPKEVLDLLGTVKRPGNGSICIGTKGVMLLPHYSRPVLLPEAQYKDFKLPHNNGSDHWKQFVEAVKGAGKTTASFDYAGPLTETVLIGAIATRFPKTKLTWDSKALKFDLAEASQLVRRTYREGWEVKGLS